MNAADVSITAVILVSVSASGESMITAHTATPTLEITDEASVIEAVRTHTSTAARSIPPDFSGLATLLSSEGINADMNPDTSNFATSVLSSVSIPSSLSRSCTSSGRAPHSSSAPVTEYISSSVSPVSANAPDKRSTAGNNAAAHTSIAATPFNVIQVPPMRHY